MSVTRRALLQTASAALLGAAPASPRPNIVLILADDLGYGDVGCFGQTRIRTPHLDRMASAGVRFTNAYAGATVCAPSRCALWTGKHTGHCTVRGNRKPEPGLAATEPTIASVLQSAGYATALFGKWGLGGPETASTPNAMGFDQFYGFLNQQHAHNSYPEHLWENRSEVLLTKNWFNAQGDFVPDHFAERTLNFVSAKHTKPFFVALTTTIPHANNERKAMDVPDDKPYSNESWPEGERRFAASITRLDEQVGRILAAVPDNTLVLFSSDNGPHKEGQHDPNFFRSSGPLRGIKRDLYDGGIRVPTLAWWPGQLQPGVNNQPWAFWDLLPTFAALAGAKTPAGDGINLLPCWRGQATLPERPLYWEFHERGFDQALRLGDWKLVRQEGRTELYNLTADPGERQNLANQEPQRLQQLMTLLGKQRTNSPLFPVKTS